MPDRLGLQLLRADLDPHHRTRTARPGEWYLHLFSSQQPDLNWDHPDVRAEHEAILRFWFDRGVAGVRIDSAALLVKDPALPEVPAAPAPGEHPNTDRDELHDIYRSWRAVADSYPDDRILVGEVWLPDIERFAKYLRPDELHTAFNFDFMARPWDAAEPAPRRSTDARRARPVGAPATWVLSNHDVTRPVTRYGRDDSSFAFATQALRHPDGPRARPAPGAGGRAAVRRPARLPLHLPGRGAGPGRGPGPAGPTSSRTRCTSARAAIDPGRDGCRVPLPWSGDRPPFGFSPAGATASRGCASPTSWAA